MKALLCLTSFVVVALVGSALVGGTAHIEIGLICVDSSVDVSDGGQMTALTYAAMAGAFEGRMTPVAERAQCAPDEQVLALETTRVDGDPASAIDAALFTRVEDVVAGNFRADRIVQ